MKIPTIIAAAIRRDGVIHTLPAPNRHSHILHQIGIIDDKAKIEQGFITNDGTYVSREEAAVIAIGSGQITKCYFVEGQLFSEDLW